MRDCGQHIATPRPLWIAASIAPGLAIVVCLVLYPIGLAVWASLDLQRRRP